MGHPGSFCCLSQGAQMSCYAGQAFCAASYLSKIPSGPHNNTDADPQLIHGEVKTRVMSLSLIHFSPCSLLWMSFISEIYTSRKGGTFQLPKEQGLTELSSNQGSGIAPFRCLQSGQQALQ